MNREKIVSLTVCGMLFMSGLPLVYGQGKKEPPRRQFMPADSISLKGEVPLPKIDLPEFLITGDESIDLPDVSKGLAEDGWVTDVSTPHTVGTRSESIPQLGGMRKEQAGFSGVTQSYNGKAQVGFGSYSTPFFDGSFGSSLSPTDFLIKVGYKSSGGHVANADYRTGYASLGVGTYLGDDVGILAGHRIEAQVGMKGNTYHLFGSTNPAPERSITRVDAGVVLNSTNDISVPYTARFSVQHGALKDISKTQETSIGLEFSGRKDFDNVEVNGDVGLWRSSYSSLSAQTDPLYTRFAGSGRYRLANSLDVRAGLSLYFFKGSDMRTLGRIYPLLGMSWYVDEQLTLFAKFEPTVRHASLVEIVESGPYVKTDVPLRHPDQYINFSVGAEGEVTHAIRSRVSVNYTQTDNTPVFVDLNSTRIWDVLYIGTTKVVSFDGEVYADLTGSDNLGASFSIRSNRNSQTGKRNPYFPSFLSSVTFQHRFPINLTFGSTLQVVGRQSTDLVDNQRLPAFAVLNLKAEYSIFPRWSVFFLLNDLLDQQQTWWDGYRGLDRTVSLGTGLLW